MKAIANRIDPSGRVRELVLKTESFKDDLLLTKLFQMLKDEEAVSITIERVDGSNSGRFVYK